MQREIRLKGANVSTSRCGQPVEWADALPRRRAGALLPLDSRVVATPAARKATATQPPNPLPLRIYRFRVLIDHPSEAFRDIEIGSDQSFLDFHNAIKEAFAFIGQEMACFYVSDENWDKGAEIPLADLGFAEEGHVPALMKDVLISDHMRSTSQRFVYAYDFLHLWLFMVELIGAGEPEEGLTYPRVVLSMHEAPDEHSKEDDLTAGILEEDPYDLGEEEHGMEDDDDDLFGGEGEEGDGHDEFGQGGGEDDAFR